MGNCCCTEEDDYNNDEEANERTRLLGSSSGRRRADASTSESNDGGAGKSSAPLQKNDEHRALSDILDQTVRNIIDVSQLENTSEQHDYIERAKRYSERLDSGSPGSKVPIMSKIKDVANADKMLNAQPLSAAEYNFMVESSAACYKAVQNIMVTPRDDLLVTFAVDT